MNRTVLSLIVLGVLTLSASSVFAHCEIPCGIYGDEMRFYTIEEHITTIEKSMKMIAELSQEGEKNYHQLVRWINNKEEHAKKIQEIIYQYFLTQRIKSVDPEKTEEYAKYVKQVTLLHQMLVSAMKAKQTTDLAHTEKLRALLLDFELAYFGPEGREKSHEHK
jgi:nickel superoxide dismutase